MTAVTVKLTGDYFAIQDALVSACRHYSARKIADGYATLTYICEINDVGAAIAGVQGDIDVDRLESLGVELASINA